MIWITYKHPHSSFLTKEESLMFWLLWFWIHEEDPSGFRSADIRSRPSGVMRSSGSGMLRFFKTCFFPPWRRYTTDQKWSLFVHQIWSFSPPIPGRWKYSFKSVVVMFLRHIRCKISPHESRCALFHVCMLWIMKQFRRIDVRIDSWNEAALMNACLGFLGCTWRYAVITRRGC